VWRGRAAERPPKDRRRCLLSWISAGPRKRWLLVRPREASSRTEERSVRGARLDAPTHALSEEVSFREGATRPAFQVSFKSFCGRLFGQCNVRYQVPRLEFVCVDRFPRVVFAKTGGHIMGAADVRLIMVRFAAQNVHVVHAARLRAVCLSGAIVARAGAMDRACLQPNRYGGHPPSHTRAFRECALPYETDGGPVCRSAVIARRQMEAGGVEPPSEKPCHPKPTCVARSGCNRPPNLRGGPFALSPLALGAGKTRRELVRWVSPARSGPKRTSQPAL